MASDELRPRVVFLPSRGLDACVLYRTWFQVRAMRAAGFIAEWRYFDSFNHDIKPLLASGRYNVVVTPRFGLKEHWMNDAWLQMMQRADLVWCYEADDDVFTEHVIPRQQEFFQLRYPEADPAGIAFELEWERTERNRLLPHVDGVTVSTEPLAQIVRQFTEAPVVVVPNAIDLEWFWSRMQRKARWIPPLTIGWAGGWRGIEDIEILARTWQRLAAKNPELRFVLFGYVPDLFRDLIPLKQLHAIQWSPLSRYPSGVQNIDLMCCSVADDPWNAAKSPIKWMEATAAGATCVVSEYLYGQYVQDGITGLVAHDDADWEPALQVLLDNPNLRRAIRTQALQTIQWKHTLKTTLPQWIAAWSDMLARKRGIDAGRPVLAASIA